MTDTNKEISDLKVKLEESERKLAIVNKQIANKNNIFNSLEDIVVEIDKNYTIIDINKKGLELINKTREETIGAKCYESIHKNNKPCESCLIPEVNKNKEPKEIKTYSNLHNKYLNINISPLFDKNNNIISYIDIIRDFSETEITKEQLMLSQQVSNLGHWDLDIINNKLSWSDEVYRMFELEKDDFEVTYEAFLDKIHPEDREKVNHAYLKSLRTKKNYEIEHRLLLKSGEVKCVLEKCITTYNPEGNPIHSFGAIIDITKQKETKAEINKLQKAIETTSQAFIITSLKGEIEYVNNGLLKVGKVDRKEQIIGKNMFDFFDKKNAIKMKDEVIPVILSGRDWRGEIVIGDYLGGYYDAEIVCSIIFDENKQPQNMIAFYSNITERKKKDIRLKESENKFNALFNYMLDGVAIYKPTKDNKDFIIVGFNKAAEKMEKVKSKDIINKSVLEVFPAVKGFGLFDVFMRVNKTGKSEDFPVSFYSDGRITGWRDNYIYKLPTGEIVAIYSDETKRKVSESKLLIATENLKTILDSTVDMIFVHDFNGNIIENNKSANKVLGYTKKEFTQKNFIGIIPENQHKSLFLALRYLKKHKRASFEGELVSKSKNNIPVEVNSTITLYNNELIVVSSIRDITDRKVKELQLKESEINLRSLFNTMSDIVMEVDYNGKFLFVAPTSDEALYVSQKEFIGKYYHDIFPKEKADVFLKATQDSISNNKVVVIEYSLEINGKEQWFEGRYKAKTKDTALFIARDITERVSIRKSLREKNQELATTNNQLIDANKKVVEEGKLKSAFLANMSHEIRTPLNSIVGFSQLIKSEKIEKETRSKYIDIINDNSKQLLDIITDVLAVSRIETGQITANYTNVDLKKLIKKIEHSYKLKAIGKSFDFEISIINSTKSCVIRTDETKLTQILNNLLNNAFKFTQEGFVKLECSISNSDVVFSISDSGIGIKKDDQEFIFNRFAQTQRGSKPQFGGTGLGLSICKGYVDILEGKIYVESKIHKGSCFKVHIPNNNIKPNETTDETQIIEDSVLDKSYTFLVAEDLDLNYELIEDTLSGKNHTVIRAKNGLEAVKICKDNLNIDFVLMDIKMPEMDGITATRIIKRDRPKLPIIAQTAYALLEEESGYIEIGFNGYVTKPIDFKELEVLINRLIKSSSKN